MALAMKVLVMLALGMDLGPCSGFPVYDYDPSSLREALSAAVAKVNAQSLSPYLFRAFRSSVKRVNVLDEDNVIMDLEFNIRETTCLRDSGADPSSCAFQRGHYMPVAACRSTVRMSGLQAQEVWAHCRWPSTSESDSSEEMIFGDLMRSYRWRNNDLLGLIPEEPRNEQYYDPSPGEGMRGEQTKAVHPNLLKDTPPEPEKELSSWKWKEPTLPAQTKSKHWLRVTALSPQITSSAPVFGPRLSSHFMMPQTTKAKRMMSFLGFP
ncbi:secreted phosphoprotein 24 [Marmota flaviventris]|uniref:secreted phosphoprotein 24 n=1 Tax=Marmota flaviventris TaxID=93162 RepID=UPI003A844B0A